MKTILSGKASKLLDKYTIEYIGIPSLVLMERAALKVAHEIDDHQKKDMVQNKKPLVSIVCGTGNNGADGLAVGRILCDKYRIKIYVISNGHRKSSEFIKQDEILNNLGITIEEVSSKDDIDFTDSKVVVDAIFGIGIHGSISDLYEGIINKINESDAYIISVDVPSGLDSDNGKCLGATVKADKTVTFGYMKSGLLLCDGKDYTGDVVVADIGFVDISKLDASEIVNDIKNEAYRELTKNDKLLPKRKKSSNKGSYGKVRIFAGSKDITGATYLSAKASYKTGAGLVYVYTHENNLDIIRNQLPEAITTSYDKYIREDGCELLKQEISPKDVIVIGPGLGKDEASKNLLKNVLALDNKKIVDADGLNIISENRELFDLINENVILTPHVLEFSRLSGDDVKYIRENIIEEAKAFSMKYGCITIIKDATTVIADKDCIYINATGNSAMATGGSGDVLTGVIAGLLAQGMNSIEAAANAVFIHGFAGDIVAEKYSEYSVMATDLFEGLQEVFKIIQ